MFEPKPISRESIDKVLEKAAHYRLLNEPHEAECICLDVLELEPDHQRALYVLILALADQVDRQPAESMREAKHYLERIDDEYTGAYLRGILCERHAKAHMERGRPGYGPLAYDWLREAMEHFEKAIELAPEGNEDGILRWNTCVRILNRNKNVLVPQEETREPLLE